MFPATPLLQMDSETAPPVRKGGDVTWIVLPLMKLAGADARKGVRAPAVGGLGEPPRLSASPTPFSLPQTVRESRCHLT